MTCAVTGVQERTQENFVPSTPPRQDRGFYASRETTGLHVGPTSRLRVLSEHVARKRR